MDIGAKRIRKLKRRTEVSETFQGEIWTSKELVRLLQAKWIRLASEKRAEITDYRAFTVDLKAGFQKIMDKESFGDYAQVASVVINSIESQKTLQERLIYLREQTELLKVSLKQSQDEIVDLSTNKEAANFISNSKRTRIKNKLASTAHRIETNAEKIRQLKEAVWRLGEPAAMLGQAAELMGVTLSTEEHFTMETAKSHLSQLEPVLWQLSLLQHPKRVRPTPYPVSHFFITEHHSSAPSEVPPPNLTVLLDSVESSLLGTEPSRPLKFAEFRLRAQHVVGKLPA